MAVMTIFKLLNGIVLGVIFATLLSIDIAHAQTGEEYFDEGFTKLTSR